MGIESLILEGKELKTYSDGEKLQSEYRRWCSKVKIYMKEAEFTKEEQEAISVKMHYTENEYSESDTLRSLRKSLDHTIEILEETVLVSEKAPKEHKDLLLIEKILGNFPMYYRAMYRETVHKRGTLREKDLSAILIGNEYDLQRMVYSILLPVFPTVRREVYSDSGYGGMRADIYLDLYNLIIEIKCTRETMTEKQLTEEMGADGFHYRTDTIYFFVYDKAGIVKNPEAFKMAFARERRKDGKTVKVIIFMI